MKGLTEIYLARQDEFIRSLEAAEDVKEAADLVAGLIDGVRREALEGAESPEARRALNNCLLVAASGAGLVAAVSEADAELLPAPLTGDKKRRLQRAKELLIYLPAAAMALLSAWLFFSDQLNASLLALASAALSFVFAREKRIQAAPLPGVRARPRVNAREADRRLENLFRAAEGALTEAGREAIALNAPLPRSVLESVQTLMEARLTDDGEYALRALPKFAGALEEMGLRLVPYSEKYASCFDLLPSERGGDTIRPAVLMGEKVVARGEATIGR